MATLSQIWGLQQFVHTNYTETKKICNTGHFWIFIQNRSKTNPASMSVLLFFLSGGPLCVEKMMENFQILFEVPQKLIC